jgi:hypothetical protein
MMMKILNPGTRHLSQVMKINLLIVVSSYKI